MTLAVEGVTMAAPRFAWPQQRNHWPHNFYEKKPVEFWPTAPAGGRAAAIWRCGSGSSWRTQYRTRPTARQVEEVLDTASVPHGIAKALTEVLARSRDQLEADERAEVARHIHALIDRSGLSGREFVGCPAKTSPVCTRPRRRQPVSGADSSDASAV